MQDEQIEFSCSYSKFQMRKWWAGLQIEGSGDEMDDITDNVTVPICASINKNRNCSAFHIGE